MKREISFRGKSKRTGEWVFGNLFDKDTKGRTHIGTTVRMCFDIDPETVGQYTGIDDREGEKIFEGDIFKIGAEEGVFTVKFDYGCFLAYEDDVQVGILAELSTMFIKKIGNIYDNKELLK